MGDREQFATMVARLVDRQVARAVAERTRELSARVQAAEARARGLEEALQALYAFCPTVDAAKRLLWTTAAIREYARALDAARAALSIPPRAAPATSVEETPREPTPLCLQCEGHGTCPTERDFAVIECPFFSAAPAKEKP